MPSAVSIGTTLAVIVQLLKMFAMSFDYLGLENAGSLLAQAYEKGEIKKRPEELERAREKGLTL